MQNRSASSMRLNIHPNFKPCLISGNVYAIQSYVKKNIIREMKYLVTVNGRYGPVSMENKITQIKPLRYDALVNSQNSMISRNTYFQKFTMVLIFTIKPLEIYELIL